ncbi:MAG TPA: tetratricopeptide repeat protein [Acidobacteriaceae bacterium]|jgi:Flp pilus assembly protein TadD|nr:tetratricopeptide repeat protein [Acidobacteriaceae bacterium]
MILPRPLPASASPRCAPLRSSLRLFIFTLLTGAAAAQLLPAGTRSADAPSPQDTVNAQLRAAETALENADFPAAIAALTPLAAAQPRNPHILYDLGFAQEHAGDDTAAAAAYTQAIAADSSIPEPRIALGLLDARHGRSDAAHRQLEAASTLPSASPELRARALRALATLDENAHPAAARDELLSALKLSPETPADILLSARLAEHAGDMADAEAAFRRLLVLSPTDPEATAGLAHTLSAQGKSAEAEATLDAALKSTPTDPRLVAQLAAVYGAEGKPQQAIPLIEALRSSTPAAAADPSMSRLLAHLYLLSGDASQAEALYRDLLAKTPTDPTLLDDLASTLVQEQKFPEAQALLSRAVSMRSAFPSDAAWADAAGHLAFAASRNGAPQVALQALSARATVLPNSPVTLFLEATAHDTLHQFKEAERAYHAFLAAAGGKYPDQEFQARHRLTALEHQR